MSETNACESALAACEPRSADDTPERLDIRYDDFRDLGESILALGEIKILGRTSQLELTSEIVQLVTFHRQQDRRFP